MNELLTIKLFLNHGTIDQINELKKLFKERYNIIAGPSDEDNTVWILTGSKSCLKNALFEIFNVLGGPCPISPEKLMNKEDANLLYERIISFVCFLTFSAIL